MSDDPKTAADPVETAREALRGVYDPELGLNVIELGLVREITVQADRAHIVMILTTPFCPYGPHLMEEARRTVQAALVRPTTIEMGTAVWEPSMMEEGARDDWGLL